MSRKIFVFIQRAEDGSVGKAGKGLLGRASSVKGEKDEIWAVVTESKEREDGEEELFELSRYGTDRVVILGSFPREVFVPSAAKRLLSVIERYRPDVFLFAADNMGQALVSYISGKLKLGLVSSCTDVRRGEGNKLVYQRPSYSGTLLSEVVLNSEPELATFQPSYELHLRESFGMRIERFDEENIRADQEISVKLIDKEESEKSIETAKIVVAGGRGLGSAQGFETLRKLADILGAELAGSRPVVNMGWISASHQVGQTGKTISPSIYIAVGISGAMHHVSGMKQSKCIIAVNSSPYAPILDIADYSIIGEYEKVLPRFMERLQEIVKKKI